MDKNYAKYLFEKTKKDYNLIADDFSRTRQNIWQELEIFKEYINNEDKILDAGCGNGRLLELLREKKVDYVGIDFSENLIRIAKEKYPQNSFLVADTLNLPFSDNNFDKVLSIAVLQTIPSKELRERAILEIKRVLKPKGLLILTVWDILRKDIFLLFLKEIILRLLGKSKLDYRDCFIPWADKTERYYHFFAKKELYKLIEKNGFRIIKKGIIKNKNNNRSNIYVVAEK